MKLLTIEEVADLLRMSTYTVARLCRIKAIPARKIGGKWRIHEGALDEWVRGVSQGTRKQKLALS